MNGVGVRWHPIDRIDVGLVFGIAAFRFDPVEDAIDDERTTVGVFGTGLQIFYWPVQMSRSRPVSADFGFGARTVVYSGILLAGDAAGDRPLEVAIEIPMTTALFIGDSVALVPEFGFVARILPGQRGPGDNGDVNPGSGVGERLGGSNGPGLGFDIGEHGGVFFGLWLAYYFGSESAKQRRAERVENRRLPKRPGSPLL